MKRERCKQVKSVFQELIINAHEIEAGSDEGFSQQWHEVDNTSGIPVLPAMPLVQSF